jgi:hypothetical protein
MNGQDSDMSLFEDSPEAAEGEEGDWVWGVCCGVLGRGEMGKGGRAGKMGKILLPYPLHLPYLPHPFLAPGSWLLAPDS